MDSRSKSRNFFITRIAFLVAFIVLSFSSIFILFLNRTLTTRKESFSSQVPATQTLSAIRIPFDGHNIKGQKITCGNGPTKRTFPIEVFEKTLDLGMGFKTTTWTYGETMPGPTIEACEGDTVTISLKNNTDVTHGLDSHAFKISASEYGKSSFTGVLDTPGVYMYHCASGPTTDLHIKAGMGGAMIVYSRNYKFRPAKEMVIVQSALFGDPDFKTGFIGRDTKRMMDNNPFTTVFNGELEHKPVKVNPGELVRLYVVNMGPGASAVHVIGSILDRFYDSGNPANIAYGTQTKNVPAGSGAVLEFYIPTEGTFVFVDHDNLRHLDYGANIPFVTSSQPGSVPQH